MHWFLNITFERYIYRPPIVSIDVLHLIHDAFLPSVITIRYIILYENSYNPIIDSGAICYTIKDKSLWHFQLPASRALCNLSLVIQNSLVYKMQEKNHIGSNENPDPTKRNEIKGLRIKRFHLNVYSTRGGARLCPFSAQ